MPQENVEIVRGLWQALANGGLDAYMEYLDRRSTGGQSKALPMMWERCTEPLPSTVMCRTGSTRSRRSRAFHGTARRGR